MTKRPIKIYTDTSVYGGVFDEEFAEASKAFFDLVRSGEYTLCVSEVVHQELLAAPEKVNELFMTLLPTSLLLDIEPDALELQQAYIAEGILTEKWYDDALHVALATVAECNVIVSWNFKHIVNVQRIRGYNAINIKNGYKELEIRSPRDFMTYEDN